MHNLSEQELDRLSKEAAENYEAAASPGLWDKLQKRLDAEMPENKKNKKRFFWLPRIAGITLLVLLAVGITVMNRNDSSADLINTTGLVAPEKMAVEQKNGNTGINNRKTETIKPNQALLNNEPAIPANRPAVFPQITKPIPPVTHKNNIIQPSKKVRKKINAKEIISVPATIQQQEEINQKETLKDFSFSNPAGQTSINQKRENEHQKVSDGFIHPDSSEKISESAATETVVDQKKAIDPVTKLKKSSPGKNQDPRYKKSWEFSAVFGPDFSNVGFDAPDKTGMNVGVLVSYRFTDRLSVQTGLLYSEKHYTTIGDGYSGYPGYNVSNPNLKMQKVQANCFMWDMPVSLRYDWLLRRKARAFVSTGLSSYFMNKEDLHYYYTYNNYSRYKAWVNEKNSSYWMAAINISLGYEQRITPQFSLQAEPFFKIPARQIGYGSVSLNSLGIFMSVKYSPQSKSFNNTKNR